MIILKEIRVIHCEKIKIFLKKIPLAAGIFFIFQEL